MKHDFEFITNNFITNSLLEDCKHIADICNHYDKCTNPFFVEDDFEESNPPCLYCAKANDTLAGFISTYIIDCENVEICCFVLPDYRKQGVATALYKKILDDYTDFYIQASIDKNNNAGKKFMNSLDFEYEATECKMILEKNNHKKNDGNIESLAIQTDCTEDSISFYAYMDRQHIGTCMVFIADQSALIHDVEIFEEYRNNGYGYVMLNHILNTLFCDYDKVLLHVTKENVPAYKLYIKLGFNVVEELEYYSTVLFVN